MHAIIRTETTHQGWAKLIVATIRNRNGETYTREIEHHGNAVCVLPYDPERRTAILIRQFRAPPLFAACQEATVEAIAGILDEPDPANAVHRETMEEAGTVLKSLERLFVAWSMPGISTERMHFYLATYDQAPREIPHGVAGESEVTIPIELPLSEFAARADRGGIDDVKTLLVLQTLRLRRPDLFG